MVKLHWGHATEEAAVPVKALKAINAMHLMCAEKPNQLKVPRLHFNLLITLFLFHR